MPIPVLVVLLPVQLLANMSGKPAEDGSSTSGHSHPLPPLCVTEMGLLTLGFSLAQPWLLQPFGKWSRAWKIFSSFCIFFSATLSNKQVTAKKLKIEESEIRKT